MPRTRKEIASVHATRVWTCSFCGKVVRGNGGKSSHMSKHVRQAGLAVHDYSSVLSAFIVAIAKLAKLHVYRWRGHRYECCTGNANSGTTSEVVAATSRSAARRLSYPDNTRMQPQLAEIYPAVHPNDIAKAMSEPGVVFWHPYDEHGDNKTWRRAR